MRSKDGNGDVASQYEDETSHDASPLEPRRVQLGQCSSN